MAEKNGMDLADVLKPRACLIMRALGERYYSYAGQYALENRELDVRHPKPGTLIYQFDDGAGIGFDDIEFADVQSLHYEPPVRIEQPPDKSEQMAVQEFNNTNGTSPLPYQFVQSFEESISNVDAFLASLESSIKVAAGGEFAGVGVNVEVTQTAKFEYTRTNSVTKTANRTLSYSGEVAAGEHIKVVAKRAQRRYRQVVRGQVKVNHRVHFWSAWGIDGHQPADWWYNSIEDVVRIMEGRGYGNEPGADLFRDRPAGSDIIEQARSTTLAFENVIKYDDVLEDNIEVVPMV